MPSTKFRLKLATLGAPGAGKSSILRWWTLIKAGGKALSYVGRQPDVATCPHSTPHVQHRQQANRTAFPLAFTGCIEVTLQRLCAAIQPDSQPLQMKRWPQVWDTAGTPQPSAASLRQYQVSSKTPSRAMQLLPGCWPVG
ncbi:hypothetical protein HaLaN_10638 [Haematococcus lacustris]|uniref:Uncharacterized protein n=1 Tax=Haematococcus lacustris TaxID=44745 RepID=A0A699Z5C8_HAELA|nr:hypothetical protein HaLaN_10638 [Haematococcus lacustris]